MDPSKAELSLMASFQNIFVQTSVYHNYCFQCSVFINWARMQHPFLFVQDCSSETSEKVLVDKLNRFFFLWKRSYVVFVYFPVDILSQQLQKVSNYAIMSLKPFIIFLKGFALKKPQKVFYNGYNGCNNLFINSDFKTTQRRYKENKFLTFYQSTFWWLF